MSRIFQLFSPTEQGQESWTFSNAIIVAVLGVITVGAVGIGASLYLANASHPTSSLMQSEVTLPSTSTTFTTTAGRLSETRAPAALPSTHAPVQISDAEWHEMGETYVTGMTEMRSSAMVATEVTLASTSTTFTNTTNMLPETRAPAPLSSTHAPVQISEAEWHQMGETYVTGMTKMRSSAMVSASGSTNTITAVPNLDSSCARHGCATMNKCQGDCNTDLDCAAGLKCFQRSAYELVPGCNGTGAFGYDYCYDPYAAPSVANRTVPPKTALAYNGIEWPAFSVRHLSQESHVFAIGDWGGMDGAVITPPGHPRIIAYPGGETPGPHVFPRSRPNCSQPELIDCFWPGRKCKDQCGFVAGLDDKAQLVVAEQFKKRAAIKNPQYILNVGDNFYWGGIEVDCGSMPMTQIHYVTQHQFTDIFEKVYTGPGLTGKPWFSVLGNHDWGGRQFTNAWDQQIAYTWKSPRWVMPAMYWSTRVNYPFFSIDYMFVDTNGFDAKNVTIDQHNMCSQRYNKRNANCAKADGPNSTAYCPDWWKEKWHEQKVWLKKRLSASKANWQIVVTHMPCDSYNSFWKEMGDRYGLDLLVTGHRHTQELWKAWQRGYGGMLGGLTCIVTGGGGGITSEGSVNASAPQLGYVNLNAQYGFFDLTVSRSKIFVESIDYNGKVVDTTTVWPRR